MATAATKTPITDKPKRILPTLSERIKAQMSSAALRKKITTEELASIGQHADKLSLFLKS